jgi:hypothetical protein
MTERIEPHHAKSTRHIGDRGERLGGIALPPRVLRQYITSDGALRCFESETRAAKELAIVATESGKGRPANVPILLR